MLRILAATVAACTVVGTIGAPAPLAAQAAPAPADSAARGWNDERTIALVARATARRAEQLADTALVDYAATARGYVTFLAQLGEGFPEPPRVVKADQLALEVYWKAPDLSKQRIVGRRDTLRILKVVGASDEFLRTPFLFLGGIQCVIAAVVALALLQAARLFFDAFFPGVRQLPGTWQVGFLFISTVLGVIASYLAIEPSLRRLEKVDDEVVR